MDIVFLKRYQAVRLLGEGRTGRAYLAQQIDLARPVFVKVIGETLAAVPDFRERFARDTAGMAQFQHPYAVALYDVSVDESLGPCLVMEYVRGLPLDQLVKANKGRLSVGRVYRLLGQLCDVLQAAHDQGIVHGSLKPANLIVVEPDSPYEKIKVTEFGMARLIKASDELKVMSDESSVTSHKASNELKMMSDESSVTRDQDQERELNSPLIPHPSSLITPKASDGLKVKSDESSVTSHQARLQDSDSSLIPHPSSLITPYQSPEQIAGEASSPAGDMFSLGVILFELLTGRLPARSSEGGDLAPGSGILRGSPTALPRSLEAVLFGCLERDPKQRIQSPRELAELFGAALARHQHRPTRKDQSSPAAGGGKGAPGGRGESSPRNGIRSGSVSDRSPVEDSSLRQLDPDQKVIDSQAVVYHFEAFMPHAIAEHKFRGFVQDSGGELMESIPGLICVRLGDPDTKYELKKGLFSMFDRRTGLIEMYLRVRPSDQDRLNRVVLTVLLRCLDGNPPDDPAWRARCTHIAQDLRSYLMAHDVPMPGK